MNRTRGEEANMKNMFSNTTALIEVPTDMLGLFTIDQLLVDRLRSWDDAFQFTIRVVASFDDLADRYLQRMTNARPDREGWSVSLPVFLRRHCRETWVYALESRHLCLYNLSSDWQHAWHRQVPRHPESKTLFCFLRGKPSRCSHFHVNKSIKFRTLSTRIDLSFDARCDFRCCVSHAQAAPFNERNIDPRRIDWAVTVIEPE